MAKKSKEDVRLLYVDPNLSMHMIVKEIARTYGYYMDCFSSAEEALEHFKVKYYHIAFIGLSLRGRIDAYKLISTLRNRDSLLRIVSIIGMEGVKQVVRARRVGAHDAILKPFVPDDFYRVCQNMLRSREEKIIAEQRYDQVLRMAEKLRSENEILLSAAVEGMASMVEHRDQETGKHVQRVKEYSIAIAKALRRFQIIDSQYLSDSYIENLGKAAPLHDLGKIGIPDKVLLKPCKLDDEEWKIMKKHAEIGAKVIDSMLLKVSDQVSAARNFLSMAKHVALMHHKWYNGDGYPEDVHRSGDDIPLSARIVSVADVFDALTSKRIYRKWVKTPEEAFEMIKEDSNTKFDPKIVDVFVRISDEVKEIRERLKDSDEDLIPDWKRYLLDSVKDECEERKD